MLEERKQTSERPELRVEQTRFAFSWASLVSQGSSVRAADAYFGLPTEADKRGVNQLDPDVIQDPLSASMDFATEPA